MLFLFVCLAWLILLSLMMLRLIFALARIDSLFLFTLLSSTPLCGYGTTMYLPIHLLIDIPFSVGSHIQSIVWTLRVGFSTHFTLMFIIYMCSCTYNKQCDSREGFPPLVHSSGVSPIWILWYLIRYSFCLKIFAHSFYL